MTNDAKVINDITLAAERCGRVAADALFLVTWRHEVSQRVCEAAWDATLDHIKETVAELLRGNDPRGDIASYFTDIANEAMVRRFDELGASHGLGGQA